MEHGASGASRFSLIPTIRALVAIASIASFALHFLPSSAAVPLVAQTADQLISTDTNGQGAVKTLVRDRRAHERLLGLHRFALQWISWDYFGVVDVTETGGLCGLPGSKDAAMEEIM
jgi:hypothetical protein